MPALPLALDDAGEQGAEVGCNRFFAEIGARVIHELRDDGFHLLDVGDDGLARGLVGDAHFGFETQAGERGAQVVRDAGEDFRAVLFVPLRGRRPWH